MKILVCIKQVPDNESILEISKDKKWIDEQSQIVYRMNLYDEYALEEAVLIKETLQDVTIEALSVGPERVQSTIKKALGKGADTGTHIHLKEEGYQTPLKIASLIAAYAKPNSYDLIFTGIMSEDGMHFQTGIILASLLGMNCASSVIKEELKDDGTIKIDSELEGGSKENIILKLPALLTIQSGINRPRYPSLSNVLRAKTQKLNIIEAHDLKTPDEREVLQFINYPEKPEGGIILQGTAEEKAELLLKIFHEKSLI